MEKARRDKVAREEVLEVGMRVLLKQKGKKKGMPRYDPQPYTIVELVGRQATIQRGEKRLKRETKKFKRFYEASEQYKLPIIGTNDDWEETFNKHHPATTQQQHTAVDDEPSTNNHPATTQQHTAADDEPSTSNQGGDQHAEADNMVLHTDSEEGMMTTNDTDVQPRRSRRD